MGFDTIAIALGDATWISLAFAFGLLSRSVGLPPLVGFLAAGFVLNPFGVTSGAMLEALSELGIILLLFVVGLKLNLRTFARPQVWAVTGLHMAVTVVVFGVLIYALALAGAALFEDLDFTTSLLIAFALSFSSTVFAVKALEDSEETASLHGRIAIGILLVQDLAAVIFLAASAGQWPAGWAILLVLLIGLRPVLSAILDRVGHGELLVLYGFLLAVGGAQLFELIGLKGYVGALVMGVLIASHSKGVEMSKAMFSFKNLFLVGFFLSIGLSGPLTLQTVLIGLAITPFVLLKTALFYVLMTGYKLRARTSLFASLNLTNFSEFGLIVAAVGAANGWIDSSWLIVIAIALALSCAIAAGLNVIAHALYIRHGAFLKRLQRLERLPDDHALDIGGAKIAIIGMGRVGTGAYDDVHERHGGAVVGVDTNPVKVERLQSTGRTVLLGDPSDADFWDRVQATHTLELVMLALPNLASNLAVLDELKSAEFKGQVAATARFADEIEPLKEAGASTVFNVYAEAGSGFATHVATQKFPLA